MRITFSHAALAASGIASTILTSIVYAKTRNSVDRADMLLFAAIMQGLLVTLMVLRGFSQYLMEEVFPHRTVQAVLVFHANLSTFIVTSVFLIWTTKTVNHRGPVFGPMLADVIVSAIFSSFVTTFLFQRDMSYKRGSQFGGAYSA